MKNNKIIAEFMGATIGDRYVSFPDIKIKDVGMVSNNRSVEDLHYNTSWDWLMPVVHKIRLEDLDFDVLEIGLPLNDVYDAVVEFINEKRK